MQVSSLQRHFRKVPVPAGGGSLELEASPVAVDISKDSRVRGSKRRNVDELATGAACSNVTDQSRHFTALESTETHARPVKPFLPRTHL